MENRHRGSGQETMQTEVLLGAVLGVSPNPSSPGFLTLTKHFLVSFDEVRDSLYPPPQGKNTHDQDLHLAAQLRC